MENFQLYNESTRVGNWDGIFKINGDSADTFGTKKELRVLSDYLEPEEVVFALASGVMSQSETSNTFDFGTNTWLVALTNRRFLFLDHAMFSQSVDTQSIPLTRVQAVSASQGLILGKISIDLGSRLAVVDNCQKEHVRTMAKLATTWLQELENNEMAKSVPAPRTATDDPLAKLERLAALHAAGALSDDEFKTLKVKLLSSM